MARGLPLLLSLTFFAAPALAQGRPAAVYPLAGDGVSDAECADLEGTLQAALVRASRSGPFVLATPPKSAASCGPSRSVEPACLSRAAGAGVVIYGMVAHAGSNLVIALSAVDGRGVVTGPVRVTIDPLFDNPQVFLSAFEKLAAVAPPPAVAAKPAPPPAVASRPSPRAAPVAAAARPSVPAAALRDAKPADPDAWLKPAAFWTGVGAVVAVGAGAGSGYLAKRRTDDLSARFATHALTASDSSTYRQVSRFNVIANTLFVASGVLALTAVVFWGLSPDDESEGPLMGRF